ncbi:hypothetical protein KW790_00385 [Candidatus Parcubacteria bacterium]|nr:hypothetical protein [Candidatus Parcubacteria bacterium]
MYKPGLGILIAIIIIAGLYAATRKSIPVSIPDTGGMSTSTNSGSSSGTMPVGQSPTDLGTKYIQGQDWPPMLQVVSGPFSCTPAGSVTATAGQTVKRQINGHTYCVTLERQGAAGSTYDQYAYAYEKSGKVDILTFTLRLPQCLNYEDPQKTECTNERNSFNIDQIIDRIAFPETH